MVNSCALIKLHDFWKRKHTVTKGSDKWFLRNSIARHACTLLNQTTGYNKPVGDLALQRRADVVYWHKPCCGQTQPQTRCPTIRGAYSLQRRESTVNSSVNSDIPGNRSRNRKSRAAKCPSWAVFYSSRSRIISETSRSSRKNFTSNFSIVRNSR